MSRCFPYPPPGYEAKNHDEGLMDSFKLQRERENTKKERKEKKKQRRERKKQKPKESVKLEEEKHSSKRGENKRNQVNQEELNHKKRKLEEIEQVEKSSITEELGQPAGTHSLYDSSDSTQCSGKKKKHTCADASHNHGGGLRIRLPLLKRKELEPPSNIEPACSSGRADNVAKEPQTACKYNAFESGILEMEAKCRDLLDNWTPPPLQIERPDFDNQEWLFERNQECKQGAKMRINTDVSIFESSGLWPRACYLPTADVYALPYTVPY